MGNSNPNGHSNNNHQRRSSSRRNSMRHIDSNVEKFFASNGIQDAEVKLSQILKHCSNSFILETALKNISIENHQMYGATGVNVELTQAKQLFSEICETFSNIAIIDLYITILFVNVDEIDYSTINNTFRDCLFFTLKLIGYEDIEFSIYADKSLECLIKSMKFEEINGVKYTTKSYLKDWILNEFPQLFSGFHNWFLALIRDQKPETTIREEKAHDLSNFMNLTVVWYLINNLPGCYTKNLSSENGTVFEKLRNCLVEKSWHPLYQSENHGLSLNRFQNNLFNYKAGTIVFIYCQTGSLYCVCSNEEYRESPTPYGDDQTRIFRLWDDFKTFNVTRTNNIFLNTKSKFLKLGLIFGYSQMKPYIKINEDFYTIEHELSPNDYLVSMEGWACGTSKAVQDQMSMKKWESKQIEKMRTVRIDADWPESADKAILDLAGVKTEHSERGDI